MRVLLVDDHEVVRKGLRVILEERSGWQVCGEARTGREAVEKARALKPHVVIMDFAMPELNGLEATRQIRRELPATEVLLLTMYDSEQLVRDVLAAGARGYMLKNDAGSALVSAVEHLVQHKPFFTSKVAEMILQGYLESADPGAPGETPGEVLTTREREIVQQVAEGKSSKEIAQALGISVHTAETHRTNLMRKLQMRSVSELVRYAIREHIIEA